MLILLYLAAYPVQASQHEQSSAETRPVTILIAFFVVVKTTVYYPTLEGAHELSALGRVRQG
jgi:hypothetical protein